MTTSRSITSHDSMRPIRVVDSLEHHGSAWKTSADEAQVVASKVTASDLLDRYPDLSEAELARLIGTYRKMSTVDIALMLSDETLGPKLQRFAKDHKRAIKAPFRDYAFIVVLALTGIAVVAWNVISAML